MLIKSIITTLLTYFIVILTAASCNPNEIIETDSIEGVKAFANNSPNNTTKNNYNLLTPDKVSTLLDKDEIDLSQEILEQINNHRNSLGLKSLINNTNAKNQALSHSEYQGNNKKMSHKNSSHRAVAIFQLENASFYGENVAFGYSNIKKLVQAWIKSESHRANIEGDFTYSGIGTIANDKGVLYYTQIFFK